MSIELELEQLRKQNRELERRLERQDFYAEVLGVDAFKKFKAKFEALQIERDDWREKYEAIVSAFIDHDQYVAQQFDIAVDQYAESERLFASTSKDAAEGTNAAERLGMVLHGIMREMIGKEQQEGENALALAKQHKDSEDVYPYYLSAFHFADSKSREAAILDFGTRTAIHALSLSPDPRVIVMIILRDLKTTGEVRKDLLERLDLEWIREHIPKAPKKHTKIKEHLELSQRYRLHNNGRSQVVFAELIGINPKTLERSTKLHEGFEKILEI